MGFKTQLTWMIWCTPISDLEPKILAPKTSSYPPTGDFFGPLAKSIESVRVAWPALISDGGSVAVWNFVHPILRNMNSMDATSPILSDDLPTSEWFLMVLLSHKPYIFLGIVHSSSAWNFISILLKLGPRSPLDLRSKYHKLRRAGASRQWPPALVSPLDWDVGIGTRWVIFSDLVLKWITILTTIQKRQNQNKSCLSHLITI